MGHGVPLSTWTWLLLCCRGVDLPPHPRSAIPLAHVRHFHLSVSATASLPRHHVDVANLPPIAADLVRYVRWLRAWAGGSVVAEPTITSERVTELLGRGLPSALIARGADAREMFEQILPDKFTALLKRELGLRGFAVPGFAFTLSRPADALAVRYPQLLHETAHARARGADAVLVTPPDSPPDAAAPEDVTHPPPPPPAGGEPTLPCEFELAERYLRTHKGAVVVRGPSRAVRRSV